MTLTYRKKLTYFHDTFIEYCLEEIIRNRKKSDGIDVPHLPSYLENSLRYVSTIPILSETSSFIVLIDNFRRTYYEKSDATEIINNLFPLTHITQIKKILSEAILDAAIEMESSLDEGNSAEDISKLAAITMLKLFGHIKSGKFKTKKINKQSITEAITKKDGWLKSIFLSQTSSARENRNYKFISEEDIQNYLKNKESRPSLSFYIRNKYNLHDDIQIVLIGKISQEIITDIDISYEGLNGYVFDSKIFRLDRAEAALTTQRKELMGFEEELEKYRNAVYQHNNLLDNHEDLIQILMKRIIVLEENQMRQKALQSSNEIYFFNVERTPVDSFVGREDKLLSIHNHFTEGKKIIEIIGGLGGIGKTQTALKYVELYKSEYNYRVRWIDAESKFTIDAAYRKFAEDLEIDIEKKSDEEIAILVKTMLEKKMKQTLLIFDNVQDRALIKTYIPSLTGRVKHHVLITTRSTIGYGIQPKRNYEDVIRLTPFTKQEALDYIRISLEEHHIIYQESEALALAGLFDNIPLGLSQSVAYIVNRQKSIKSYIEEYTFKKEEGLPICLQDATNEIEAGHRINIYATMLMTLDSLSPEAISILRTCSYLHANAIPISLFHDLFSEEQKTTAIAILHGYSLISIKIEKDVLLIDIHRLIQEVTRTTIEGDLPLKQTVILLNNNMISGIDRNEILSNGKLINHPRSKPRGIYYKNNFNCCLCNTWYSASLP